MAKLRVIVILLAGLAVALILATKFSQWMDRGENAWAYADPPLMGGWQGDAVTGDKRLRLVISLTRDKFDWTSQGDSVDNHRTVSGQVILCDSTGRVQAYPLRGVVEDKAGRSTHWNRPLRRTKPPGCESLASCSRGRGARKSARAPNWRTLYREEGLEPVRPIPRLAVKFHFCFTAPPGKPA